MKNCPACGQATPKKMAKGGGAEGAEKEYVSGPSAPTEGVEPTPDVAAAAEGTDPEEEEAPEEAPAPSPLETAASSPAAPAATAPSPLAPTAPAAPKDVVPAPDNTIPVIGEKRPETVPMPSPPTPMTAQEMAEEHQSFDQDLAASHIHPKTYNDLLWNDKSTPGKIGSIFGLMLSGMGSGLAHQPNMLMAMMDKTIDNDLNAQKATAEGARNLYNLHLQHQDMRSRLQHNYYASAAAAAATNLKPKEREKMQADIDRAAAATKQANAETASINTKNAMLSGALKYLNNSASNMQGPGQQQAVDRINNVVAPAVNAKIQENTEQGAAKAHLIQATAPYPKLPAQGAPANADAPVANMDALRSLGMVPELSGRVTSALDEAKDAATIKTMAKMYNNAFTNLNTPGAGQGLSEAGAEAMKVLGPLAAPVVNAIVSSANPAAGIAAALGDKGLDPAMNSAANTLRKLQQWRAAQVGVLTPMFATMITHRYNPDEAASQAEGMLPTLYDMMDEKTRKSKFDNTMAMLKGKYDNETPNLNFLNAKASEFPGYEYPAMHSDSDEKTKSPAKKKEEKSAPMGTMVNLQSPFKGMLTPGGAP